MNLSGYQVTITQVNNCLCFQEKNKFTGAGKALLITGETRFCMGWAEGLIPALSACVASEEPFMEFQCTGGFMGCSGEMTYRVEKVKGRKPKAAGMMPGKNFAAISKLLLNLPMFKSFDQDSIAGLLSHFQFEHIHDLGFKSFKFKDVIIQKGQPGTHLYIIVAGKVEIVDEVGNVISHLSNGEVFGEMSLISGNPVGATVRAVAPTTVFRLDSQDFKRILSKFPELQSYFTKLLTQRLAQSNVERSLDLSAGMTGKFFDIPPEEVLQTLNINQKNGVLSMRLEQGEAVIYFKNGELVHSTYAGKTGIEAVAKIIECRTGKFNFIPKLPPEADAMPSLGNFMAILMDSLKDMDEKNE